MKAVITGDIVKSTSLSPSKREELYRSFKSISDLIQNKYSPDIVPYPLSNFRGDGWQLVIDRPEKTLEIALFLRTYFRFTFGTEKIDTRIAIGMGEINFSPSENVSAGDGPAYTLSGRLLESLTRTCMGLDIDLTGKEKNPVYLGLQNTVILLDLLVTKWSASQCQAVFWALQHKKQAEIAKSWQPTAITQASVSYNLHSAGWDQIDLILENFETTVKDLLRSTGEK